MTEPEPRSTERLLADAEERLRITADLPGRIEQIRGWATSPDGTVRVTTTVHGALTELEIADDALALGPDELARAIVALAGQANRAALVAGIGELSPALGDAATAELAETVGLAQLQDPPAPVLPYIPGVDPNADKWTVIDSPVGAPASAGAYPTEDPDDDPLTFDFSRFRSDR
jgi:YbaB/EbfC DNA-binding family